MTDDNDLNISRDDGEEEKFADYAKTRSSPVPKEFLDRYFPDGFSIRDEANAIAAFAFRNGPIERLHAGESSELLGNEALSRITNSEMRELMIFACRKIESLLRLKASEPDLYQAFIQGYAADYCYKWER